MSIYKRPGSTTWSYDFQIRGVRFSGSTGAAERRAAERYERDIARPAAERTVALKRAGEEAFAGKAPLTLRIACARYHEEHGQHQKAASDILFCLDIACQRFGMDRDMATLTDSDIAAWVAQLRGRKNSNQKSGKVVACAGFISNRRVNGIGVERMSALFGYAKTKWKAIFPQEPDWKAHLLEEPRPTPREINASAKRIALDDLAEGYRAAVAFKLATGLRLAEILLRWEQIDWENRIAILIQKGGRPRRLVLSAQAMAILGAERGRDPVHVFTYLCRRRGGNLGKIRRIGERYPLTYSGLKSAWKGMKQRTGLSIRLHDARHTRAMTLLRATGNLKAVQEQLGHARIDTTSRTYALILDEDMRRMLDAADAADSPTSITTTSPRKASND